MHLDLTSQKGVANTSLTATERLPTHEDTGGDVVLTEEGMIPASQPHSDQIEVWTPKGLLMESTSCASCSGADQLSGNLQGDAKG